jgi:transcriptional regulator with XRE-family HTH domain
MWEIGKRLREQRKRVGLTIGQIAVYEGCSVNYLSKLERGINQPNVWPMLANLARRYHTSADYLLGLSDDWRPAGSAALPPLSHDEERVLALWRSLDDEQRGYVLDTLSKLQRWSQPRVIGGDDD